MYLVFDTETTGLPLNYKAPLTDFNNWPRMVQLAWQIHDIKGDLIEVKNYIVKPNTQDLLSAFYYARTLDLQNAEIGQEFVINTFFDREMYPLKIKFLGKEEVETKLGEFNCLKFRPMVEKGRVFKEEEDMTLWISNDSNKVPIRLKANLLVGSIKMDLVEHKNLSDPLNQIDD